MSLKMGSSEKKKQKAKAKALKKKAKAEKKLAKAKAKQQKKQPDPAPGRDSAKPSPAVKFAEGVRGILSLILAVSLVIAIILSNNNYIISLEDIFNSLIAARIGKVILTIIAVALFIFGLKRLRAIK